MSFCDDREDIYSIALTTLSSLIKKYNIDLKNIGRLEVGTETMLDKSKSVKSVLMQLFEESGNFNVEGIDTVNACFGGTNAVFNAVNWVESSAWDGREAIVVAGDIALYKKGNARPTGGAGCVAMLIGPDAPLAFEPGLRGTFITHAYDFYKPDLTSEYPYVDGQFSLQCYTKAVDKCYTAYNAREQSLKARMNGHANGNGAHTEEDTKTPIDRFDFMAFHAPTCKLVSKSYARMLYNDFLADPTNPAFAEVAPELRDLEYQASLTDKTIEKTFMGLTKKRFAQRVQPANQVATQCGNMYCGSVYGGLVGLISNIPPKTLEGKKLGIFSYGSGLASAMFSLKVIGDTTDMVEKLNLQERLDSRKVVDPKVYDEVRSSPLVCSAMLTTSRCACCERRLICRRTSSLRAARTTSYPGHSTSLKSTTCSGDSTQSRHKFSASV
jgi:hydroxymethylglutaryl-CoA synthase